MSNIVKFRTWPKWPRDILMTVAGATLAGLLLGYALSGRIPAIPQIVRAPSSPDGDISGTAYVIDGDTVKINRSRIRLHGIDAPELKQRCWKNSTRYSCGQDAKSYLVRLIGNQSITCKTLSKDKYGRDVAKCFTKQGVDINAAMVSSGQAVAYLYYSYDYAIQHATARIQKRGIWAGRFTDPYLYRKENRES